MGIKNALVVNNSPQELEKYFTNYFDKIIIDAPCSGEGMFKKEEAALKEWSLDNVLGCSLRQRSIIESAAKMLKPGGKMVYSTCTFSLEENEMVVDSFLKTHKEFELLEIEKEYGFKEGFVGKDIDRKLLKAARLFPHKVVGEGHFIALMTKIDGDNIPHKNNKSNVKKEDLQYYYKFANENLNVVFDYNLFLAGDELFRLPDNLCEVKGLRILRAGLHLGSLKKNRFEPNHALALGLQKNNFKYTVDLHFSDREVFDYLTGNTINYKVSDGWCGVLVDDYPLGWGKSSSMMVKNHYPKGLRWNSIT
jgi:NOL1/NOP2/fmu family ribosome biogenesis protein